MTAYRSKPKTIQAVRISAIHGNEVVFEGGTGKVDWLQAAVSKDIGEEGGIWVRSEGVRVGTLEGTMRGDVGDYIVRGVMGEIFPLKSDIFHATYEPL